jgi:hypothetical protein
MFTLVLYDDNNICFDCFTDLIDPFCEDNNVFWVDGALEGIQTDFIILDGYHDIEKGQDVSPLIESDIKSELKSIEQEQNEKYSNMQLMVNSILLDPTDTEQNNQILQTQTMLNNIMLGGL